jgi:hypothetical protein
MTDACLVCETRCEVRFGEGIDGYTVLCPRCGEFYFLSTAERSLLVETRKRSAVDNEKLRRLLSHGVRHLPRDKQSYRWPLVRPDVLRELLLRELPTPQEQADSLIRWAGELANSAEDRPSAPHPELGAIIGTRIGDEGANAIHYILRHLAGDGILTFSFDEACQPARVGVQLTFEGWKRFEELKSKTSISLRAFMAMKFGESDADDVFVGCFIPAVARAGFELRRLDAAPEAGLIDNRLRAEIRAARFLIADLSHANLGAYWEAGFAEGLGKPVIYTCEKGAFEDKSRRPHFDVNHHTTIIWSADDLERAGAQLTATVRNTFPASAKLTDD